VLDTCKLCRFIAGGPTVPGEVQPVALAGDEHWIAALNENQATLGRVYLVLKRHEEDITQLSATERESLFRQTSAVKTALTTLFAPDHFNYMFHMNLVRHAHFHIYPRYAAPRRFAGYDFP
jgi:diadenosine tetraphosphate (Ap4A) HIT family hydrolase